MALTSLFPAQGLQSFIDESLVQLTATNGTPGATQFRSSVVNRAPITDISQNLKVSMGIERTSIQQLYQLQNESGPNGEPVWSALNDDRGSIRFVGNWASGPGVSGSDGPLAFGQSVGDYCEITFYGTALNVLTLFNSGTRDWRASVDGGTEGANIWPSSGSNVLQQRNYMMNTILPVVGGLALGLHTVKIRNAVGTLIVEGFEVINESTTIKTNPGSAFVAGKRLFLSAQDSQSPTSGFTNTLGSAGIKGGHVLQYLASDGTVKKDIQYVDATALFLTAADHTNEEMVRTYSPREFGAGRSDDFSTLIGGFSSRAFTLDDGTTSLVGANVQYFAPVGIDGLTMATTSDFFTFTFVGTGLDLVLGNDSNSGGTSSVWTIAVDGTSQGTVTNAGAASAPKVFKVASGLPYGTHTAKVGMASLGASRLYLYSFKVYQPKKPSLPAGAVELADYNVMATFSPSTIYDGPASGVVRKQNIREMVYVGSPAIAGIAPTIASGVQLGLPSATAEYVEYTFFGTGFESRLGGTGAGATTSTLTVDGSANLTAFTTSSVALSGAFTYSSSTGAVGMPTGGGGIISVSGLTLGLHKFRITKTSGAFNLYFDCIDIITPIHSAKSNLAGDLQNALPVGSCALSDNRSLTPIKGQQTANKYRGVAVGVTSGPTVSLSSSVPLPDMSLTVVSKGGWFECNFQSRFRNSGAFGVSTQLFANGVAVGVAQTHDFPAAGSGTFISTQDMVYLPAGTHKIDTYWLSPSGTATAMGTVRSLSVKEL